MTDGNLVDGCPQEKDLNHNQRRRALMIQEHIFSQKIQRKRKEIVLVESHDAFADLLREVVWQETSCKIFRVSTGEQALRIVPQLRPDLLIVNFQLSDMTGVAVFEQLHTIQDLVSLPIILLSTHQLWTRTGPSPSICVDQPLNVDDLLQIIAAALGEDIWAASSHRGVTRWQ